MTKFVRRHLWAGVKLAIIWASFILLCLYSLLFAGSRQSEIPVPIFSGAPLNVPYAQLIFADSQKYGADPYLVAAVIRQESNFNARAYNTSSGAAGLGQQIPLMQAYCGMTDVYEAEQAIDCTARIIGEYQGKYDDNYDLVLAAYHAGEPAVNRCNCVPDTHDGLASTQTYVDKVNGHYRGYRGNRGVRTISLPTIPLTFIDSLLSLGQAATQTAAPLQGGMRAPLVIAGCSVNPAPVHPVHSVINPYKPQYSYFTQDIHGCGYGHFAFDIANLGDDLIHSPITGQVTARFYDIQCGNTVIVISNPHYDVTLLHGIYDAPVGAFVLRGQIIGVEASIGCSTGPHTHITIYDRRAGGMVDPGYFFTP